MANPHQPSSPTIGRRSSGPQGTQLFSADELNKLALETAPVSDGRASAKEPVLEGIHGALQGRRFSLRAGRQTIGRRDDNDIVINDLSVSSAHAWIMNQQGHYVVMNTLSTNGTFVNNKRVHEATIRHGDLIRFGQVEFVFLTREPGASRRARVSWFALAAVALMGLGALAWWWLKA
jgi:hypothetical protein